MSRLLCVFAIVFCSFTADAMEDHGETCREKYCKMSHGKFNHNDFTTTFKYITASRWNNYFIHIKNPQAIARGKSFLHICSNWKCDRIDTFKEQILVYKQSRGVGFYMRPNVGARFQVEFYSGCNLIDDNEININFASGKTIGGKSFEKCWIMIPRLKKSLNNYETQNTEFSVGELKNSNLLRDSSITVTSLINGNRIAHINSTYGGDNYINIAPAKKSIGYNFERSVSTVIMLQLDSCPPKMCDHIEFELAGMTSSQVECIMRKEVCNHIDENDETCMKYKDEVCEGFDIEGRIEESMEEGSGSELVDGRKPKRRVNCNRYRGYHSIFCSKNEKNEYRECSTYIRCSVDCIYFRLKQKITDPCKRGLSIFH